MFAAGLGGGLGGGFEELFYAGEFSGAAEIPVRFVAVSYIFYKSRARIELKRSLEIRCNQGWGVCCV